MIAVAWVQAILDGLGGFLAFLYGLVPNYGVAIILLTLVIRVLLLPLGIKQIRSMQAMQRVQPRVKALQQKYKGNRQRLNEEMMKLYKEEGVNPLAGCLPLVAQLPVLFALFAVLQFPGTLTHIPTDSALHAAIERQDTRFLGANLLCNALQAGQTVPLDTANIPDAPRTLDCGSGIPVRIPFFLLAFAMIGTTYYQQRQMQRASPAPAQPQQQTLMRIMPLVFGFWGFIFPAGLVLYWTTTNLVQIGQQHLLLSRSGIRTEPEPVGGKGKGAGESKGEPAAGKAARGGAKKGGTSADGRVKGPVRKAQESSPEGKPEGRVARVSNPHKSTGGGQRPGGRDAGDRKKRRKR